MKHNIHFLSKENIPINNADNWYSVFFEKQFREYGQDSRRVFNSPEHIKQMIQASNPISENIELSEVERLALDTTFIFMDSELHQAQLSAEKLFKVCYHKSRFAMGFFMQPFPTEALITAAELIRARRYTDRKAEYGTLNAIVSDASREWLARDFGTFKRKIELNILERMRVRETFPETEYKATLLYLNNMEEIYFTDYGVEILQRQAISNIRKFKTLDFDVSTATFK